MCACVGYGAVYVGKKRKRENNVEASYRLLYAAPINGACLLFPIFKVIACNTTSIYLRNCAAVVVWQGAYGYDPAVPGILLYHVGTQQYVRSTAVYVVHHYNTVILYLLLLNQRGFRVRVRRSLLSMGEEIFLLLAP